MTNTFLRFPGGKIKAVTLSYDDNVEEDVRLVEIMKKHGLKGTFNINSGQFSPEGSVGDVGNHGHRRMTVSDSVALHKDSGMEIACHGVDHAFMEQLPPGKMVSEILEDRKNLEQIYGTFVRGMAYPFGTYNDDLVNAARACGIVYSRTVESTHKFDLPTDWLRLPSTCHHTDPQLMDLARTFIEDKRRWSPKLFYLWGHSYEFEDNHNWNLMEDFASYVGERDDVWYATNIEIYNYVSAYRRLIFSADGETVCNPTTTELFIKTGHGTFSVASGETKKI